VAEDAPDGTLHDWEDIAIAEDWQVLLVGNGLSRNIWEPFGYSNLFDDAARAELTEKDRALFEGTTNFERVLGDLSTAIRVAQVVGLGTDRLYDRYRNVQRALGQAVRRVHLNRMQVPEDTLAAIRTVMENSEWIFTTSYDLLIYWAMGHGGRYAPFKDHFRYASRCQFDPERSPVYEGEIPVYYLHGALHLIVGGKGETWKLRMTALQTILDQFGRPIAGDPQARPLLVTEGSAQEKMRAIEGNGYLSHSLDRLRGLSLPVVVFGSALSRQDDHLVEALNEYPERPVAVSMRPGVSKRDRASSQADLWGRLTAETVYFYDSTSHPLGADALAAPLT
jgi:hypothetical protein